MGSIPETPESFLESLYANAPGDAHTHLTFGKKKGTDGPFLVRPTVAFRVPEQIPEMMATARAVTDANVYYTPGVVGPTWSGSGRTQDKDVSALVAVWADLDIVDKSHKAPDDSLFADMDDVRRFLAERFPIPMSAIINSGHGAHAYWLLDEPVVGDDIGVLLTSMKFTFDRLKMQTGKGSDAVFHPGRLMRVPGTVNINGDHDVPVTVAGVTHE